MADRADADDPRRLAAQFELVQRELARAERRLAALQDALIEAQQAIATLDAVAATPGSIEALVPIGAGVHVRAAVDPHALVLRPLGAGYATESSAAEAQRSLAARSEAVQRSFQEASEEADRLANTAAALNERLSALAQQSP